MTVASWQVWTARDGIVGRHRSWDAAWRACRNDGGRLLTIYDPTGRIAALVRDGRLADR